MLENIPILQNFVIFLSQNAKYLVVTLLILSLGGNIYQYLDSKESNNKLVKVLDDGIKYERTNKSDLNNILMKVIETQSDRQKSTDQLLQEILDNQKRDSLNHKRK